MTTTYYTDAGVSPRTNVYAERQMLRHAGPVIVLDKFGQTKPMPRNKTQTIKFRRPRVFSAATTPLSEGVTPTAHQFSYDDVSATLSQFGDLVEITDHIEDTHEDPVLNDVTVQSGENVGRTVEQLIYGVVKAGTNVFYANGTARSSVNTVISLSKLRAVVRSLKTQKSMKITRILDSSLNYATRAIEASYPAVVHTHVEADIRDLAGFIPTAQYGQRSLVHDQEFGAVEEFRFVCSPDLDPWADGGGATSTMITTSGSNADVYPVLCFGKEAYGTVPLRGKEAQAIEPSIIRPGVKSKSDPLGQRGYVGWKLWFTAVILNDLWMARLEVAATDL